MMSSVPILDEFIFLLNQSAVEITVKPSSKKNILLKTTKGFVVEIKSVARNNLANEELEKFLTKITKQKVKIVFGKTSNKKLIKLV